MGIRLTVIMSFFSLCSLAQSSESKFHLNGVGDSLSYDLTVKQNLTNRITTFNSHEFTLEIPGVQDITGTKIHANTFLEVQFRIRGGSGVKMRRTVLLCVSEGKIYKSLDILSEITSRLNEVYDKTADSLKLFDEKEDYYVKISVNDSGGDHYMVELNESKTVESKYDPTQNIFFEKAYELNFDVGGYFLYNSVQPINKLYKAYSTRSNKTVDRFINSDVHIIQLYEYRYLYFNGEWCFDNSRGELSCW